MGRRARRNKRGAHRGLLATLVLIGLTGSLLSAAPAAVAAHRAGRTCGLARHHVRLGRHRDPLGSRYDAVRA